MPIGLAATTTAAPADSNTLLARATASTTTTTVYLGPCRTDIATLPTSSLAIGICVLCLRVLAQDICGHELGSSVKVVLHTVQYGCFSSFDTRVRRIHASEQGFNLLRFGITRMLVLFEYTELFLESRDVRFEGKNLFVFIMKT